MDAVDVVDAGEVRRLYSRVVAIEGSLEVYEVFM